MGCWFGTFFHTFGKNHANMPTDCHIFQRGWNHQPVTYDRFSCITFVITSSSSLVWSWCWILFMSVSAVIWLLLWNMHFMFRKINWEFHQPTWRTHIFLWGYRSQPPTNHLNRCHPHLTRSHERTNLLQVDDVTSGAGRLESSGAGVMDFYEPKSPCGTWEVKKLVI